MVPPFLLHVAANMSIGGVSGKGKFGLWGRMLEGYCPGWEAFCILESLLSRAVYSNVLGPPFGRSVKGRNTCS
jgi:hypothetical protein